MRDGSSALRKASVELRGSRLAILSLGLRCEASACDAKRQPDAEGDLPRYLDLRTLGRGLWSSRSMSANSVRCLLFRAHTGRRDDGRIPNTTRARWDATPTQHINSVAGRMHPGNRSHTRLARTGRIDSFRPSNVQMRTLHPIPVRSLCSRSRTRTACSRRHPEPKKAHTSLCHSAESDDGKHEVKSSPGDFVTLSCAVQSTPNRLQNTT